jgi:hypothetical protein
LFQGAREADGEGVLCMFMEKPESIIFYTLRSAYNRSWFLGVGRDSPFGTVQRLFQPPYWFCGSHFNSGPHGLPIPKRTFYSDYIPVEIKNRDVNVSVQSIMDLKHPIATSAHPLMSISTSTIVTYCCFMLWYLLQNS